MLCYLCRKFNKIPVVNFNRGLFVNNTSLENNLIQCNENWFFNYFENYNAVPPSIYEAIIKYPKKNRINLQAIKNYQKFKMFCHDDIVLEFRREAFLWVQNSFYQNKSYRELIPKYLRVLPHIGAIRKQIKETSNSIRKDIKKSILDSED